MAQPQSQARASELNVAVAAVAVAGSLLILCVGIRHFAFLCDDAYISFRYARNLVDGHGLVFNPGEYVEGYTNFLWTVALAGFWAATGISPERPSMVAGALFTFGTTALVARLAYRSPLGRPWIAVPIALALYCTNRTTMVWATGGLSTRMFTFWLLLGLVLLHERRERPAWASAALGVAALTRPEALLFGPLILGWHAGGSIRERNGADLLRLFGPFGGIVVSHLLFRVLYYGALLPNTFAAKGKEIWPEAGGAYLASAFVEYGMFLLLPLAFLGAVARWSRHRDAAHVLSALLVVPHLLFVARVGGDHFEFRMFDLAFPLLHLAVVDAFVVLTLAAGRIGPTLAIVGTAIAVFYQGALPWLDSHATSALTGRRGALHVDLAEEHGPWVFAAPGVATLAGRYNELHRWMAPHLVATRQVEHRNFQRHQVARYGAYAPEQRRALPPGLTRVVGSLGVGPFFLAEVTTVDLWGLTDRVVARSPAIEVPEESRKLAHVLRETSAYLDSRRNIQIFGAASHPADQANAEHAVELAPGVWMPFTGDPARFDGYVVEAVQPGADGTTFMTRTGRLEVVAHLPSFQEWTHEDHAFEVLEEPHGRTNQGPIVGAVPGELLNSFHPKRGDRALGVIRSPPLDWTRGDLLGFRIAGGRTKVGVYVVDASGRVLEGPVRGRDDEVLRPFRLPVDASGPVHIEIRDGNPGGWGHIVVQDLVVLRPG